MKSARWASKRGKPQKSTYIRCRLKIPWGSNAALSSRWIAIKGSVGRWNTPDDFAQRRGDGAFGTGKPGMEAPVAITSRRERQRFPAPFIHSPDRLVDGHFEHTRRLELGQRQALDRGFEDDAQRAE